MSRCGGKRSTSDQTIARFAQFQGNVRIRMWHKRRRVIGSQAARSTPCPFYLGSEHRAVRKPVGTRYPARWNAICMCLSDLASLLRYINPSTWIVRRE